MEHAESAARRDLEARPLPGVAGLFPDGVRVAAAAIEDHVAELFPAEVSAVARAVEKRKWEYSTGRVLARRLFASLGLGPSPLVAEEGTRFPVWPAGVVGSISHAEGVCIVAVARAAEFALLGVDVEPDAPPGSDIERTVLCQADSPVASRERAWVAEAQGPDERGRRNRVVFSVKEAVYKTFHPRVRRFWGFQDVQVELDTPAERFVAHVPREGSPTPVEGRVLRRDGWILSGLAIRNHEPSPTD